MSKVSLEALGARVAALAPEPSAPAEPAPGETIVFEPAPGPEPLPEPIVLDYDLQVVQRLRFLAWMRRVQLENRRAEARPAPR